MEISYKTGANEFWCLKQCMEKYQDIGPVFDINKKRVILEKRSLAEKIADYFLQENKSKKKTPTRICRGCTKPLTFNIKHGKVEAFCNSCKTYMRNHICINCHNPWDENIGCDEYGFCIQCSSLSTRTISKTYPDFIHNQGICPNCASEWVRGNEALCPTCLERIESHS